MTAFGCSGINGQSNGDRTASPPLCTVGAADRNWPEPPADGRMPLRSAGWAAGCSVPVGVLAPSAPRCSSNVGHGGTPSAFSGSCAGDCDVGAGAGDVTCARATSAQAKHANNPSAANLRIGEAPLMMFNQSTQCKVLVFPIACGRRFSFSAREPCGLCRWTGIPRVKPLRIMLCACCCWRPWAAH